MFEGFYFLRTAFLLKVVERTLISPCAVNKSQDPVKTFSVFYEICKKTCASTCQKMTEQMLQVISVVNTTAGIRSF